MTDPRRSGPAEPADDQPPANVRRLERPAFGPTYGPSHADTYGPLYPPTPPYGTALGPQRKPPVTPQPKLSTTTRVLIVLAVLVAAAIAVVPVLGVAGFLSAGSPPPTGAAAPAADRDTEVTTPPGPEFRVLSADQWGDLVADPEAYIGENIVVHGVLTRSPTDDDPTVRALVGSSRLRDTGGYATRASIDRTDASWDGFAEGDEIRVNGMLLEVREDAETGDDVLVLDAAAYGVRRYG
jgi:hypothetical protein